MVLILLYSAGMNTGVDIGKLSDQDLPFFNCVVAVSVLHLFLTVPWAGLCSVIMWNLLVTVACLILHCLKNCAVT